MYIYLSATEGFRAKLRYNEKKVEKGVAELIHAGNFILDAHRLTLDDKIARFQKLIELNPKVLKNTLHVTINFHPGDNPSRQTFIDVAKDYMEMLEFHRHPFLVYEHRDTAHPHIHILTTNIRPDGNRKELFSKIVHRPIPIVWELEEKHHLIPESRTPKALSQSIDTPRIIEYGKMATWDAIASTLQPLLTQYNYTSLAELNALLRQYNLTAYTGKPGGHLHNHGGLLYQIIDKEGKTPERGIKSSNLPAKPGLKYLEQQFAANRQNANAAIQALTTKVEVAIRQSSPAWQPFAEALRRSGIQAIPYTSPEGRVYGLIFIDYPAKLVAEAGRLGPSLSVDAILARLSLIQQQDLSLKPTPTLDIDDQRRLLRDMHRPNPLILPVNQLPAKQKIQEKDRGHSR